MRRYWPYCFWLVVIQVSMDLLSQAPISAMKLIQILSVLAL